jgi:hypothetical protein
MVHARREGAHERTQESMELFALLRVEDGRELGLALRLGTDRPVPDRQSFLRRLDQDAAPIVGVRDAADEASRLHPVEAVGHRAAGKTHLLGELTGGPLIWTTDLPELPQNVEGPAIEPRLDQRLVQGPVERLGEFLDALDRRIAVTPWEVEAERRQEVLAVDAGPGRSVRRPWPAQLTMSRGLRWLASLRGATDAAPPQAGKLNQKRV